MISSQKVYFSVFFFLKAKTVRALNVIQREEGWGWYPWEGLVVPIYEGYGDGGSKVLVPSFY